MAHQSTWGDTAQPLAKLDEIPRDKSWLNFLPDGASIISTAGHGASYWSQSGKVDVELQDGRQESYFIKLSRTALGRTMVEGEYEAMKELHAVSPHLVPKPIGYGTYVTDDDIHFFICEFVDLYDGLPDIVDFCRGLAELHLKSRDHSPNGKFGFQVTTCNGTVKQYVKWTSSWETFFIESLKAAFEMEEAAHGPSDDIARLLPDIYEKVCPRLLRPLETEGRTLRPCLVHGDMWDGNVAEQVQGGQPCIFDAAAFWAHNEYDHHIWRGARFRIGRSFVKEYFNHFPISAPEDDWDDRNLLYSLRSELHASILFKQTDKFRKLLIRSMEELVEKFPRGYEGTAERKPEVEEADSVEVDADKKVPTVGGKADDTETVGNEQAAFLHRTSQEIDQGPASESN